MSRHPNNIPDTGCRATKIAEDYVQLITVEAKPTVTDLKDLIAESNSDEMLSIVPIPQVNPLGPVVDRPVRNRRPPGHLKDCVVKTKYSPLRDLNNA